MDLQVAQSTAQAFQHGFSVGVAFALVVIGAYLMYTRRRDP